ncbi:hypothetical protein PsorP6_011261 [Peronosclerospora sorghi]|uniref:Uncharacterized protein n=1 Tax=Peronosclerospora sorghi TaxID=230839 RepID=A0ACC0WK56_9STRA|nr:hypothetical protein PsorP6_011261 [Peronosclerospora sorghi]
MNVLNTRLFVPERLAIGPILINGLADNIPRDTRVPKVRHHASNVIFHCFQELCLLEHLHPLRISQCLPSYKVNKSVKLPRLEQSSELEPPLEWQKQRFYQHPRM